MKPNIELSSPAKLVMQPPHTWTKLALTPVAPADCSIDWLSSSILNMLIDDI